MICLTTHSENVYKNKFYQFLSAVRTTWYYVYYENKSQVNLPKRKRKKRNQIYKCLNIAHLST